MPIPEPNAGESADDFHSRCMSAIWDEYKGNPAQANAICFSAWRNSKSIDTGTGLVGYDLQGQRKKAGAITGTKRLYGLIEKVEEVGDGTVKVHGIASTEDEDDQGEIVRAAAMRAAIPDYMKFGAVREMHGMSAAGRALECNCGDDDITRIVAHVVDPIAVSKVKHHVYNGFSIGGRVVERESGNPRAISRLALHEISLVDRPANPQATIDLWKSGESQMPDGLGTMESAFAEALAKTQQYWRCDNPAHAHFKKEEAANCMAKSASRRPQVGDPQTGTTAKHGFPDGPPIHPSGTEKHGLPGEGVTQPGEPPGGPRSEENFDGDHDGDDDTTSAETAGGGYQPESDAERHGDFAGKKGNGDGKPKGDYGDVTYADPGYRGKPRYPIDNEGHVRAAWSYINMPKNAKKYTPSQLSSIKSKIKAAAKKHGIEISEKLADVGDESEIAFMIFKAFAGLEMLDDLVIEKAGRRQSAADTFLMNVVHDGIAKLTDSQFCMKAEANAVQDTMRNPEHPAPNPGTDSGTAHYRVGENSAQDTAKRGMRHSTATLGYLRKAHDAMCKAGAMCGDGMSKASTTEGSAMSAQITTTLGGEPDETARALRKALKKYNKLQKAMDEKDLQMQHLQFQVEHLSKNSGTAPPAPPPAPAIEKTGKLKKLMDPVAKQLAEMQEKIDKIASTPIPGVAAHLPAGVFDVSKSQDGRQGPPPTPEQQQAYAEIAKYWQGLSPEQKFAAEYQVSKLRPYTQQR